MGMANGNANNDFLRPPRSVHRLPPSTQWPVTNSTINSDEEYAPAYRNPSHYNPLHTFKLPSGQEKHYKQQYGDMYFLRLARLKPAAEQVAAETWDGFSVCAYTCLGYGNNYLTILKDCRGTRSSRGTSAGRETGRIVLGRRDDIHGYAAETEYSGGFDERGELACYRFKGRC